MKKAVILAAVLMIASAGWGLDRPIINREDLSLKAGPTAPGEGLSLVWVEAYIYPKVVKDERVISLGVRTASKVSSVKASFSFSRDAVELSSYNGMQWGGAYKIPPGVDPGLHVVRYAISGRKGGIQRTVDFFLGKPAALANKGDELFGEGVIDYKEWPLTVTSTCTALVGWTPRTLSEGDKVMGISKVPWYKIVYQNGEEGWVPASKVKEPLEEFFAKGFNAYRSGNYRQAIKYYQNTLAIDPDFAKAYFWLAKCYYRQDDLEASYRSIKQAMRLDERDIESKVLANSLAGRYFSIARGRFRARRYHEAVAAYQKVLDLKPSSAPSWIELGKAYERLGLAGEARSAWREALGLQPDNKEIYALLGIKGIFSAAGPAPKPVREKVAAKPSATKKLPAMLADDSLEILKAEKTRKGTAIETALKSVISLTKSLGTPVVEKGWEAKHQGDKYLVRYICEQGQGAIEAFEWLVDVDTRQVSASNDNARVLMNRW